MMAAVRMLAMILFVTRRTCSLYGGISNQSWHNDDSTPGLLVLLVDALHHVVPLQLSGMWQMALRQMATLQEFERRPNFNQSHINLICFTFLHSLVLSCRAIIRIIDFQDSDKLISNWIGFLTSVGFAGKLRINWSKLSIDDHGRRDTRGRQEFRPQKWL